MANTPENPRMFIGSSKEGLDVAMAIQHAMRDSVDVAVWSQGIFELGKTTMENLHSFLEEFDFAAFIITADDKIESRGKEYFTARDNVIFEIGLFIGGVGRDRVIIIKDYDAEELILPSDMNGITFITYSKNQNGLLPAIGPAVFQISEHIKSKLKTPIRSRTLRTLAYVGAICFRVGNNGIEYLLINTTEGRKLFPKGAVLLTDATVEEGAKRVALREAGVVGRVIDGNIYYAKYYKEDISAELRINAYLIEVTQLTKPTADFREPKWYDLSNAIANITLGRDFQTGFELVYLLEWAEDIISNMISKKKGNSKPTQKEE